MAADVLVPRVSRYRSVRKAHQQRQSREEAPPLPAPTQSSTMPPSEVKKVDTPVGRTASRYHRPRVAVAPTHPEATVPPVPAVDSNKYASRRKPANAATINSPTSPVISVTPPPASEVVPPVIAPRTQESSERLQASIPLGNQRYRPTLQEQQERLRAAQLAQWEALGRQAEEDRLHQEQSRAELEEQEEREKLEAIEAEKRRQEEERRRREQEQKEEQRRLKEQEEAALAMAEQRRLRKEALAKPLAAPPASKADPADEPTSPTLMGLFKRRRGETNPHSAATARSSATAARPKTSHVPTTKSKEETIRPGGGGVVPLADAPVSAVNHGERRVMVECGKSRIQLPIDPTTTPMQLIRSASNVLSEEIDTRAAVIYEIFDKANVQRKLRMYEHVRDVMNSWDSDDRHSLVIKTTDPDADPELYAHHAPKSEPSGGPWELYYSNKRGKWDKRQIVLRRDGQLLHSKSKKKKDEENICHLSDYDIYELDPVLGVKRVKPPKKYCYGVKSQQKSGIFMTSTNFIHMFSTNDAKVADSFYRALQSWRSWYLVDVMGEGNKKVNTNFFNDSLNGNTNPVAAPKENGHARNQSEESHYLLGTFNDLGLDASQFRYSSSRMSQELDRAGLSRSKSQKRRSISDDDRPLGLDFPASAISRGNKESVSAMHARKLSQRAEAKRSPPLSYPSHMIKPSEDSSTFAAGGLLGGEYERRKEANDASTDAIGLKRTDSDRSSRSRRHSISNGEAAGGLARQISVKSRMPDKPLVDLTPQYKEAPQFSKKGHGYKPAVVGEGGLIDAVPEKGRVDEAFKVPSSTTWKRPVTSAGASTTTAVGASSRYKTQRQAAPLPTPPTTTTAGYDRAKSLRGQGTHRTGMSTSSANVPSNETGAFTGDGLLAQSKKGWGAGGRGHGVMRGSDAKGPMVDLSVGSKFAEGSLLRRAEERGAWSGAQ